MVPGARSKCGAQCLNLRSFGSKSTVLKSSPLCLWHCWDFSAPPAVIWRPYSDSTPGELCPLSPRYAPASVAPTLSHTILYAKSLRCKISPDRNSTFWKSLSPAAYAEKFSYFRGGFLQWHRVFICFWCALFVTSHSCFQTNVLAKFIDTICMFLHTHSPYFSCYCTEYKPSALQVRISEENTLVATTQQFIAEKISRWALKQGSKTHSSLRQSNLQLQFLQEVDKLTSKNMQKQLISFSQVIKFL